MRALKLRSLLEHTASFRYVASNLALIQIAQLVLSERDVCAAAGGLHACRIWKGHFKMHCHLMEVAGLSMSFGFEECPPALRMALKAF